MLKLGAKLLRAEFNLGTSLFNKSQWSPTQRFWASSYSRKDVNIPVPIADGHIAVQVWEGPRNSSSPSHTPVLCLHGVQDNSCSFDALIPLILKDNMTVVSIDHPGHGLSSHTKGAGYDFLVDGVATIHRVMRHHHWDKIILVGHSFGSILSFVFTGSNPEKVEKYVAIDAIHVIERDPITIMQRAYKQLFSVEEKLCNPNIKQPSYTYDEIFERVKKARKGEVTDEGIKILLRRGAAPTPNDPGRFHFTHDLKTKIPNQFGRFTYEQSLQIAENIRCPVCFIKGEPGADYEPRERLLNMADRIKKGNEGKLEFHLVPGSHHLHLDDPERVAPIISRFFETKF